MHDSAVASVSPRSRQSVEHDRLDRRRSRGEHVLCERRARAPPPARRTCLGAGLDERGRRGSRSRARRSSPRPRRRRRRPRRAPPRRPTPRRRRSAARAARAARARASRRRSGAVSSAIGQSCRSSRGGPGASRDAASSARTSAGAVPARPTTTAPSGTDACLWTPGANSLYGRRSRSGDLPRPRLDAPRAPRARTSGRPAARASSSTVRSSWVGPRPPEMTSRSCSRPSRSARSSSVGASPTMRTSSGSMPERDQRLREVRPVAVGAVAAHELASP